MMQVYKVMKGACLRILKRQRPISRHRYGGDKKLISFRWIFKQTEGKHLFLFDSLPNRSIIPLFNATFLQFSSSSAFLCCCFSNIR